MENFATGTRSVGAAIAALATFLWGSPDAWLLALIALVCLDYITGIVAAVLEKKLSSKAGFHGILKKMLFFSVVAVAHIIDAATELGGVLRSAAIGFLAANEGISILENSARCGIPVSKKLLEILEQLRAE